MTTPNQTASAGSPELLQLESPLLSAAVRPGDGGRLVSLVDKRSGQALVWTNRRTTDVFRPYQCNYDDLSNGGVEEAFPTVQPCQVDGADLPFFGEVWNLPWRVGGQVPDRLALSCYSPVYPALLTKTFSFSEEGNALTTRYRIENVGAEEFPYVFGVHPSLTLEENAEIFAPEGVYTLCSSTPERAEGTPSFLWPHCLGLDFRQVRSRKSLGCYNLVSMPATGGAYGVVHRKVGIRLTVEFDPAYFRCLSLWPIYGGFRGHCCLMSEVFTCYPASLREAIDLGMASTLPPGGVHETEVVYRVEQEENRHGA